MLFRNANAINAYIIDLCGNAALKERSKKVQPTKNEFVICLSSNAFFKTVKYRKKEAFCQQRFILHCQGYKKHSKECT